MVLLWGLRLELKKSLRTKKFWAVVIVMLLLYIPVLYAMKSVHPFGREFTASEIVSGLISVTLSLAKFFITILAIVLGATAINAEITEGTLRVALSKPISRLGYITGKLLGHLVALFAAIFAAVVVTIIGVTLMGVDVTGSLVSDVILLNLAILVAMLEFLALGYIISLFVKSTSTAIGIAIVLLFLVSLMSPILVDYFAHSKAEQLTREKFGPNWETMDYGVAPYVQYNQSMNGTRPYLERQHKSPYDYLNEQYNRIKRDYEKKYLFFDPITQLDYLLGNLSEKVHVTITNTTYYPMVQEGPMMVADYKHPIKTEVTNTTEKGYCKGATYSGGSTTKTINGTPVEEVHEMRCYTMDVYRGVGYSIKQNLDRLWVLIGVTLVYLGIAFYRFLRMDLR
nr:ABC transporter permease subunit [Thermococcus sp. Bubb.Bath]